MRPGLHVGETHVYKRHQAVGPQPVLYHGTHFVPHISGPNDVMGA